MTWGPPLRSAQGRRTRRDSGRVNYPLAATAGSLAPPREVLPVSPLIPQRDAAAYLGVSVSYLRASSCPKVLLPGTGPRGKPLVRYRLADLDAWAGAYRLTPR